MAEKRESGNINQVLFPIIFQIGTERENTRAREPDMVLPESIAGREVLAHIEVKF